MSETSPYLTSQIITALAKSKQWQMTSLLILAVGTILFSFFLVQDKNGTFWGDFLSITPVLAIYVGFFSYYLPYYKQIKTVQHTQLVEDLLTAWEKKYIISIKLQNFKRKLKKQKRPQLSKIQRLQNINRIQYSQINTFQFWVILLVALFGWVFIYSLYSAATFTTSTQWDIHYFYKIIIVDVGGLINLYGLVTIFLDLRKLKSNLQKLKQATNIDVEQIAAFCQKEATCNYHVGLLILFNAVYFLFGIALTLLWIAVFDL